MAKCASRIVLVGVACSISTSGNAATIREQCLIKQIQYLDCLIVLTVTVKLILHYSCIVWTIIIMVMAIMRNSK